MRNYVEIRFLMEKDLWEKLDMTHKEAGYVKENGRIYLKGAITRHHMQVIRQQKIYGHHGLWIDPHRILEPNIKKMLSGDLEVDLPSRRVKVHAQTISLMPEQYEMLLVFLRHPGQILSRELLQDMIEIRGNKSVDTNAVTASISRLRHGLQDASRIKTIHQNGYQWTQEVQIIKG